MKKWLVFGAFVLPVSMLFLVGCHNPVVGSIGGSGTISGTITIAGYPVQGVTVSAGAASATTDSQGSYTIGGLADGSYTVTPTKANYSFSPLSSDVQLSGSSGVGAADFTAGPALPVPVSYQPTGSGFGPTSSPIFIAAVPLTVTFTPTVYGGYINQASVPCDNNAMPSGSSCSGSISVPPSASWIAGCAGVPNYPFGGPPVWDFNSQRITLIDSSGNIVSNPQGSLNFYLNESQTAGDCTNPYNNVNEFEWTNQPFTLKPLTQKPVLELTAFWNLLGVDRVPATTTEKYSQTVTYGVTQTSTTSFTNTFNATAGFNIGGVKTTLSDTFSATVANAMSITQTTSTTTSYTVSPGSKNAVLAFWQLDYQIAAVQKATSPGLVITNGKDQFGNAVDSYGYVAFTDPSFVQGTTDVLSATDVAPLDIPEQADIVPQVTLFTP